MTRELGQSGDIDLPGHYSETRVGVPQIMEMEICYLRIIEMSHDQSDIRPR